MCFLRIIEVFSGDQAFSLVYRDFRIIESLLYHLADVTVGLKIVVHAVAKNRMPVLAAAVVDETYLEKALKYARSDNYHGCLVQLFLESIVITFVHPNPSRSEFTSVVRRHCVCIRIAKRFKNGFFYCNVPSYRKKSCAASLPATQTTCCTASVWPEVSPIWPDFRI